MRAGTGDWLDTSKTALNRLALWRSRSGAVTLSLLLTVFIGVFDYLTGTQISLSAFYLLPVSVAAWFVGLEFGLFVAIACVVVWVGGNVINGDDAFETPFLVLWNGSVQLASYLVVVIAVNSIRNLQRSLERRVAERAAALTKEIAERERLQRQLLVISEREQRRIGQDLHDGLCQHLTGSALAGQVLHEKLAKKGLIEAIDARHIVELIEEGVLLSRRSAKGLHPIELDAAGLMLALEEFAATTARLFNMSCRFECDSPVLVHDAAAAEHMFRIVQESVRNAINHGRATHIVIKLEMLDDGQELRIEDDGRGMPSAPSREGMGLRIMAHRAEMIGGSLRIGPREGGGTVVCCAMPSYVETEDEPRERIAI
jgi:signal transduction histidine kinase